MEIMGFGTSTTYRSEVTLFLVICMVCGPGYSLQNTIKSLDQSYIPRYTDSSGSSYELARKLAFLTNSDYSDCGNPSSRKCSEYEIRSESLINNGRPLQSRKRMNDFLRLQDLNDDNSLYNNPQYEEKPMRESFETHGMRQSLSRNPVHPINSLRKKQFNPSFGLDSIGLRKRSSHFKMNGSTNIANPLKENLKNREMESGGEDNHRIYAYGSNNVRHTSVVKRDGSLDSDFHQINEKYPVKHNSKSKNLQEHDHVLDDSPKNVSLNGTLKCMTKRTAKVATTAETPNEKSKLENTQNEGLMSTEELQANKSKKIEKKSIDWSDYFGLDRRKKSSSDVGDDVHWALEKYHKAIEDEGEQSKYPLKFYQSLDKSDDRQIESMKKKAKDKLTGYSSGNARINELNNKLQSMEDSIIDDAIKYTGGHEGITDKQEVQKVKDELINRLAAAYNLENMRRALNEYKLSAAREKQRLLKEYKDEGEDVSLSADKRLSLSKNDESAEIERDDYEEIDGDTNFIQNEEYDRQSFNTPDPYEMSNCPEIDQVCNKIMDALGHYAQLFRTACRKHKMCLLCGNSNWFAPARHCNVQYLIETYEYCGGVMECQREAQRSVHYILEANRSVRPESLEDCNLTCPEKV